MGFLNAVRALGELSSISGWEAYLKFPLEKSSSRQSTKKKNKNGTNDGHKIIRVWLDVKDPYDTQLEVRGVKKIDLIDYKTDPGMKLKYLYRDRVGANVFWGFTPIFKMGKPKKDVTARKSALVGESGNWQQEQKSVFYKLQYRLLSDYETCEVFSPESVDKIMSYLDKHVDQIVDLFDGNGSFIMVFGVSDGGQYLFPGEIPAFVSYFQEKLLRHVQKGNNDKVIKKNCFCCNKSTHNPATLDKVFKFATFDKVNVLPGLNKNNELNVQPVCEDCLQLLVAGREKIEREFADKSTIRGLIIWLIPEVIEFGQTEGYLKKALDKLNVENKGATGMGKESERRFFHRLTKQDKSLVFHFLFWERLNAQERVHLMVEDVPPSRLARLEKTWCRVLDNLGLDWDRKLDTAFSILYSACMALSGQSNEDKLVMRDFVIKLIGKLLKGEILPVQSYKAMFVRRVPKLVFDSDTWSNVRFATRKAQLVVEFMDQINKEVALIEAGSEVS